MSKPLFPLFGKTGTSANQMRFFHGAILTAVMNFVNSHGHDFTKDETKEYLKKRFGYEKSMSLWSFEEMDVFLDKVMDWLDANDIELEKPVQEENEQTQESSIVRPA